MDFIRHIIRYKINIIKSIFYDFCQKIYLLDIIVESLYFEYFMYLPMNNYYIININ